MKYLCVQLFLRPTYKTYKSFVPYENEFIKSSLCLASMLLATKITYCYHRDNVIVIEYTVYCQ